MLIKLSIRRNLIHLIYLLVWTNIRKVETIIIRQSLGFSASTLYILLMFIGEFLAGLIIYLYQIKFLSIKNTNKNEILIKYIKKKKEDLRKKRDSMLKQYFLIFICGFFDFFEFTLSMKSLSPFFNLSGSLERRLSGVLTITSSLSLMLVLKYKILKHQKVSLIFLSATLGIIIITEFIYQRIDIFLTYGDLIISILVLFIVHIFTSLIDIIEKYLYEFNSTNQFKVLMWEGIFGIILTSIYFIYDSPFEKINNSFQEKSVTKKALVVILLIIYVILSGGRNAYRVHVNKIYSPVVETLTDFVLTPFYLIYSFCVKEDFLIDGVINYFYFIINLVASVVTTFFGCVYNEFIILFFCGLEYDTYEAVSRRSKDLERTSNIELKTEEENDTD